jgi:hypothetical protein
MVLMRWDNLRLDVHEGTVHEGTVHEGTVQDGSTATRAGEPLLPRGAVARTFDTPGFRGMTFYEIHAKSIVSRVPDASRVPFRWTINPYRGCQHSCLLLLCAQFPHLPRPGRGA